MFSELKFVIKKIFRRYCSVVLGFRMFCGIKICLNVTMVPRLQTTARKLPNL